MKKDRLSNIELLRIIAMFMVLVVHADFVALGAPTTDECVQLSIISFVRIFFESISFVCVDVFIIISGWFGINPTKKSFCNFIFQCIFFLFGIYAIMIIAGKAALSANGLAECFLLLESNWFIKSYICLYILSPIFNTFVENTSRKTFGITLISFYCFQSIYGWVSHGAAFLVHGYSVMSFIGLYLLTRYIRLYNPKISQFSPPSYVYFYLGISMFLSCLYFVLTYWGLGAASVWIYSYVNPLMILSAFSLFLFFTKLRFSNKTVNKIAASSFAIFLLHANPNILYQYFTTTIKHVFAESSSALAFVCIFVFLLLVSTIAILIDQIRLFAWKRISKLYFTDKK